MLTDMFFVLSGFTFVLAYKEKIEDGLINFNFFWKIESNGYFL